MNKSEIAAKIKETEDQLASLRAKLEEPEYPTLGEAKPGDKLENGCIVVHKVKDLQLALIAAPATTEVRCGWSKEFSDVFDCLAGQGFNKSQWFIPNVKQLQLAHKNCKEHFASPLYWSSTEVSSTDSCFVGFGIGTQSNFSKATTGCVRAFSLVSY